MRNYNEYLIYIDNIDKYLFEYIYNSNNTNHNICFKKEYIKTICDICDNNIYYNKKMGYKNIRLFGPYNKYNIKLYKFNAINKFKKQHLINIVVKKQNNNEFIKKIYQ